MLRRAAIVAALFVITVPAVGTAAENEVLLTIRNHTFSPAEVTVKAGVPVTLRVRNEDATQEEFESKTLKVEKIVAGNSEAVVRLRPLKPGRYEFVGEFHEASAKGTLIAE